MRIVVVGASGDLGQRVVARLCDLGHTVVATGRSATAIRRVDPRAEAAVAAVADPAALAPVLAGAERIVNIAHAATIGQLIPLVPPTCRRLVLVGSTRRYSRVPDPGADAVRDGEQAFLRSRLHGSMLHPTMIYGGDQERNVSRVLALVARWPRWLPLVWPVPDGGRSLVQPVYIDDIASAIVAAATRDAQLAPIIVVAGPRPIALAEMLRACAAACGRRLRLLPVPTTVLIGAARLLAVLSRHGPVTVAELQRAREDKAFDIGPLRAQLGVEPRSFVDGLAHLGVRHCEGSKLRCMEQSAHG